MKPPSQQLAKEQQGFELDARDNNEIVLHKSCCHNNSTEWSLPFATHKNNLKPT